MLTTSLVENLITCDHMKDKKKRQIRHFSESFKREKVKELEEKNDNCFAVIQSL